MIYKCLDCNSDLNRITAYQEYFYKCSKCGTEFDRDEIEEEIQMDEEIEEHHENYGRD